MITESKGLLKMPKRKPKKNSLRSKLKKKIRTDSLLEHKIPRVRREFLDVDKEFIDFLKKNHYDIYLYYAQFMDEYLGAAVKKTKTGRIKKGHLHNTEELLKPVRDANNRRNNDVYGVTKANGLLFNITDLNNNLGSRVEEASKVNKRPELVEDAVIAKIDEIEASDEKDLLLSEKEFKALRNQLTDEMVQFYLKRYNLK